MRKRTPVEDWEVALIKAMLARGVNDQSILSYFTRPSRSVNHRVIGEIRLGKRKPDVEQATDEALDQFVATWPDVDAKTGLSITGDELLIKAREAMIAAVHTFNGAGLTFRAELFVVTAIIAWTYLMHAWFMRQGIDYRYRDVFRNVIKTKAGADKYWELLTCIRHSNAPLPKGVRTNLEFIIELRNEIEHRSTNRLDDALSAKLQACCINFNDRIKSLFGPRYGLEKRLPVALQFVTFSAEQRGILKSASTLPQHIESMMEKFHNNLAPEELTDPQFAYRVVFVQKTANRATAADLAIEFVKAGSEEGETINRVLLKEVERPKFGAKQIVALMRAEGFPRFTLTSHARLWLDLDAKNPAKGFGVMIGSGTWYWYDKWLDTVRSHCRDNATLYQ
jgi:hypothetical protein